jgi:hypothetical protein
MALKANTLVGGLFILIGFGLMVAAIAWGATTRAFIHKAKTADGVVVETDFGSSHPQIEFTTASGKKISHSQGGMIHGYKVGDRVRVLYDPADPQRTACLDKFGALYAPSLFSGIISLGLIIGAILTICGRGDLRH